jgi:octaprenyl-diphosphate synthase
MCVLLGARIGGRMLDVAVREIAMCAELIHAATLLHDDVIDDGAERRGDISARLVYGNEASILSGDFLVVHVLKRIHTQDSRMMGEVLETLASMVESEAAQLAWRGTAGPNRQAYLEILKGKTAALFQWCFRAGGMLAGLPDEALDALGDVGTNLGMSYQIVDDILDLNMDDKTSGKTSFSDIREGKFTCPLILACERDDTFSQLIGRFMADGDSVEMRSEILERMHSCGAVRDARSIAVGYAWKARDALLRLPRGRSREAIEVLLDLAVHRRS